MAGPFDSNAGDNSRIQAYDCSSETTKHSGESSQSCKLLFLSKERNEEDPSPMREMMLPPRQAKATSPPQKSRVSLTLDRAIEHELLHGSQLDPNLDPKTLRRTISNRISAQRSRMKRTQYIFDLEKKVHDLEELVSSLTPKFEAFKEKKRLLQLENESLRTQVDIRATESKIKEDSLNEKRREIEKLKESVKYKNEEGQQSCPKPYSIEFYQERLMQVEMSQFINQELHNRRLAPHHPQPQHQHSYSPWIDPTFDDCDLEIDQFLNLDDHDIDAPSST